MNKFYSNIEIIEKNNLEHIVNLFFDKIQEFFLNMTFSQFIEKTNKLIDSLIDICIKNKINYFIKNHISFSSIKSNFKLELENCLQEYTKNIYPNIESNIINISLQELNEWNNIIDILSKNPDIKNKVSFSPTAIEYTYGIGERHNRKSQNNSKSVRIISFEFDSDQIELTIEKKIAIYLKIIFINETYINNLKYTIKSMCQILNDLNTNYDILNPYKKKCMLYDD